MELLRQALSRPAKADVMVTTARDGARFATSATAVSELSFDPPSTLVCVNPGASIHSALVAGSPVALNILHHSQMEIAVRCGGGAKGEDRLLEGQWHEADAGIPRLVDAQVNIVGRNVNRLEHGQYAIFIGEVEDVVLAGLPEPLLYLDGNYTRPLMGEDHAQI